MKPLDPRLLRHASAARRFVILAAATAVLTAGWCSRRPSCWRAASPAPSSVATTLRRAGRRCWWPCSSVVAGRAALAWARRGGRAPGVGRRRSASCGPSCSPTSCGWARGTAACPRPASSPPWPPAASTRSTATSAATCRPCSSPRWCPPSSRVRILFADLAVRADRRRDPAAHPALHDPRRAAHRALHPAPVARPGRAGPPLPRPRRRACDVLVAFGRAPRPGVAPARRWPTAYRRADACGRCGSRSCPRSSWSCWPPCRSRWSPCRVGLRLVEGRLDLATALLVLILAPEVYLPLRAVGARFHDSRGRPRRRDRGLRGAGDAGARRRRSGPGARPGPGPRCGSRAWRSTGAAGRCSSGLRPDRSEPGERARDARAQRQPASRRCSTCCSGCAPRTRDGSPSAASTSPTSTATPGCAASPGCRSGRRWCAGTVADNIRLGEPGADPGPGRGGRRRPPRWTSRSARRSARTAAGCPPASGAGSRWPGRVLADRPLLLLDEPTEGVDADTEDALLAALPGVTAGRTAILVSHRAEVLARCATVSSTLPAPARPAVRAATASPRPAPQERGPVAALGSPRPTPSPPAPMRGGAGGWPAVEPARGPPGTRPARARRTARCRRPRQRGGAHRDLRLADLDRSAASPGADPDGGDRRGAHVRARQGRAAIRRTAGLTRRRPARRNRAAGPDLDGAGPHRTGGHRPAASRRAAVPADHRRRRAAGPARPGSPAGHLGGRWSGWRPASGSGCCYRAPAWSSRPGSLWPGSSRRRSPRGLPIAPSGARPPPAVPCWPAPSSCSTAAPDLVVFGAARALPRRPPGGR